jgi:predicted RNA-binding protein with PIN domain
MSLIIDAYNVLHCTHTLPEPWAMMSATDLCRYLESSPWAGSAMTVVCDGKPKPEEGSYRGSVRLIYSGPGRDADSVIEQLIATDHGPRDLIVVSNDRRIQSAAKRRKAKPMSAESFLNQLVASARGDSPNTPPDMGDTDDWLKEFGYE